MAKQRWPGQPPPKEHPVEVDVKGTTYRGSYHISGREVVVRLKEDGSSKKAELQKSEPEFLAKLLLQELVSDSRLKKR